MIPPQEPRFQVCKDILCSHLPDDESVILNLDAGIYYGLNPVGTFNWQLLANPRSLQDLVGLTIEEFAIDPATCEADLHDLLQELSKHELIQVVAG
jgi:hypothetical protein